MSESGVGKYEGSLLERLGQAGNDYFRQKSNDMLNELFPMFKDAWHERREYEIRRKNSDFDDRQDRSQQNLNRNTTNNFQQGNTNYIHPRNPNDNNAQGVDKIDENQETMIDELQSIHQTLRKTNDILVEVGEHLRLFTNELMEGNVGGFGGGNGSGSGNGLVSDLVEGAAGGFLGGLIKKGGKKLIGAGLAGLAEIAPILEDVAPMFGSLMIAKNGFDKFDKDVENNKSFVAEERRLKAANPEKYKHIEIYDYEQEDRQGNHDLDSLGYDTPQAALDAKVKEYYNEKADLMKKLNEAHMTDVALRLAADTISVYEAKDIYEKRMKITEYNPAKVMESMTQQQQLLYGLNGGAWTQNSTVNNLNGSAVSGPTQESPSLMERFKNWAGSLWGGGDSGGSGGGGHHRRSIRGNDMTEDNTGPSLTKEQSDTFDALQHGSIPASDPRVKSFANLSDDQLKAAGIMRYPDLKTGSDAYKAIPIPKGASAYNFKKGSLSAHQSEAYNAAIGEGLSPTAAKALVANMSGEALFDPSNTTGDHGQAQGIVQWHYKRAEIIKNHFGKYPHEMSVAEQTKAAIWEMKTNPYYHETWEALKNGKDYGHMMHELVWNYEGPADKEGAFANRMNIYNKLNDDKLANGSKDAIIAARKDALAEGLSSLNGTGLATKSGASSVAVGDSIAQGYNNLFVKGSTAGATNNLSIIGGLEYARVGANPETVLHNIQNILSKNPNAFKGKNIDFSTGLENNGTQLKAAEEAYKLLEKSGANQIIVSGMSTSPKYAQNREALEQFKKDFPHAIVQGNFNPESLGMHPANPKQYYGGIKSHFDQIGQQAEIIKQQQAQTDTSLEYVKSGAYKNSYSSDPLLASLLTQATHDDMVRNQRATQHSSIIAPTNAPTNIIQHALEKNKEKIKPVAPADERIRHLFMTKTGRAGGGPV